MPVPEHVVGVRPPVEEAGAPRGDDGDLPPPPPVPDEEQADQAGRRRRNRKEDALSIEHMLNHKPSNPYCDACMRGKMRDNKKYKGAFSSHRVPKEPWELVTCDHLVSLTTAALTGATNAFILKDVKSRLKEFCPMASKNLDDTTSAL
eukprot:16451260-Heterocapsa_arctica.AAC.1